MKLANALLKALRDHGARAVFGIPGDFVLPFFKFIEQANELPLYTFSHEPAIGFAADAAARMEARIGVACVTYGSGGFNMLNAVAGAYAEKSPLVVVSGAPGKAEVERGLLVHHQARSIDSQLRAYREVTCDQAVLNDAAEAPGAIARVLRNCREQSRPVYIEFPRDMVEAECEPVEPLEPSPVDPEAIAACAEEILTRMGNATRPVLMVGVEVRRFGLEDRIAELAGRLDIPVVTSLMGRGLMVAPGAPLAGTYMGVAGDPGVAEIVEGSDALLLLGVILSDTNFGVSGQRVDLRRAIIAADRGVRVGFHTYPDVPLANLIDALMARTAARDVNPAAERAPAAGGMVADDGQVTPPDIALAVNDLFDEHGLMPIASDMGDCWFTAMDIRHTPLVAPGYYATMGFGVPAGLGIQAATGERMLILVGDGAFQMTGWELGHCHRYGWDPIVIVFNNSGWEMLRTFQPGPQYHDLGHWKFADIADALGGRGHRVATREQLKEALDEAVADRGRFQLIEVMLERGAISSRLQQFVEAIRAATAGAAET